MPISNSLLLDLPLGPHQFSEAVTLHGEHGEEPGTMDLIFHFLSINWKVLFAFVPPTSYLVVGLVSL